jgi:hypothetical protein
MLSTFRGVQAAQQQIDHYSQQTGLNKSVCSHLFPVVSTHPLHFQSPSAAGSPYTYASPYVHASMSPSSTTGPTTFINPYTQPGSALASRTGAGAHPYGVFVPILFSPRMICTALPVYLASSSIHQRSKIRRERTTYSQVSKGVRTCSFTHPRIPDSTGHSRTCFRE